MQVRTHATSFSTADKASCQYYLYTLVKDNNLLLIQKLHLLLFILKGLPQRKGTLK
jgi:hypothetical protein